MRLHHKVRDLNPGETMDRIGVEPRIPLMGEIIASVKAALAEAGHDPIFVHVGLTIDVDVVVPMHEKGEKR
jgi:hypothetical protein